MAGRSWGFNPDDAVTELIEAVPAVDAETESLPLYREDLAPTAVMLAVPLADEVFGDVPAAKPAGRTWGMAPEVTKPSRRERRAQAARPEPVRQPKPAKPSKPARRGPSRLVNALVMSLVLVLAVGGGFAVWKGMQLHQIDAPLPEQSVASGDGRTVVGPEGDKPVEVTLDDGTVEDGWDDGSTGTGGTGTDKGSKKGKMAVPNMGNSSVFIPSLGAYAPVLGTSQTKGSRHAGWQTLMIPTNPRKVSWYSGGADLAGGENGTTLLAGHIAYNGVNGAFRWLANTKPGNVVWTKNANGALQKWVVKDVFYKQQTDFPQSYWSGEGERQLVMVTCGGPFVGGHYQFNTFVRAIPAS